MTWADFQTTVLAYLNRQSSAIPTVGSVNLVVVAANLAKTEAQRRHHFKMARAQGFISSDIQGADMTTQIFTTYNGNTIQPVKRIEQVWQYGLNGTTPVRYKRVPATTLGSLKDEYGSTTLYDINVPLPNNNNNGTYYFNSDIKWYIQGQSFFLLGVSHASPLSVMLDCVKWMPDYDGSITDFFLSYHLDWMVLKTVDNLNRWLKDDQRVLISQQDLEKRWTAVVNFDESYQEDNFEAGSTD